jgi:hypothetical protein
MMNSTVFGEVCVWGQLKTNSDDPTTFVVLTYYNTAESILSSSVRLEFLACGSK